EGLEKVHLSGRERCNRQPVAVKETIAGQRSELWTRRQYTHQVERVGSGERNQLLRAWLMPGLAERADRLGQRKLLAGEAGNEATSTDLAVALEPAIDAQQVPPRGLPGRLAVQQTPEHDAVALQQSMRHGFDSCLLENH